MFSARAIPSKVNGSLLETISNLNVRIDFYGELFEKGC
jgi:hypothetical protein